MEQQEPSLSIPAAPSSPPCKDPDFLKEHSPDPLVASSDVAEPQPPPPPSVDQMKPEELEELRRKIIKQVEYYFSDENLPTDSFLLKHVRMNRDGYVPIGVIASFRKMKKLTKDTSLIVSALRESTFLGVSSNGKRVKRLHPLPLDARDPLTCTVLVENLPENHSSENLSRIFSEAGKIKNMIIRTPNDGKELKTITAAEKLISGKLHALVEFENVEAAEKAVATLNNEGDWRHGLRVKLLKKSTEHKKKNSAKVEQDKVTNKGHKSEISADTDHHSTEQHDSAQANEDENGVSAVARKNTTQLPKEKNGQKGRNWGRGRRMNHHATNGHGAVTEPCKPPPGPRMPDGTRGFAMGRGRPTSTV